MAATVIELLLMLVEKMCVIVVLAYIITRTKYFTEILDKRFTLKNRAFLILIFGGFSIFGTYAEIEVFGAIANIRDLGPMIAGLIGGPVIGVGAGLIGGIRRYFLGGFTGVPCSLATVLAGLFGGVIYQLRKGKFIGVAGAVVFYTDGVTEAINEREQQFEEARLFKLIKENHTLSAKDLIAKIKREVLAFCGDAPQFDDITLMVLKAGKI